MIDPVTAIAGATTAFNFLKKSISIGRDLSDMGQQLQQWAGCMAELDQAEKMIEKPPWYKALGGGTQAQAMEVFMARKKAQQMRDELREIISHPAILGPSHWQEFLRIEAEIRKQKREHEFRRMEIKQTIIEWGAGVLLFIVLISYFYHISKTFFIEYNPRKSMYVLFNSFSGAQNILPTATWFSCMPSNLKNSKLNF